MSDEDTSRPNRRRIDLSGGAGIQADLKTVSALGAFGMTAITALTAQNTTGVYGVLKIEPKFVVKQIEACVSDIGCDAVKTGMLASTAIIDAVAAAISGHKLGPLVVDPVMIAKSGAPLLKSDAIAGSQDQVAAASYSAHAQPARGRSAHRTRNQDA